MWSSMASHLRSRRWAALSAGAVQWLRSSWRRLGRSPASSVPADDSAVCCRADDLCDWPPFHHVCTGYRSGRGCMPGEEASPLKAAAVASVQACVVLRLSLEGVCTFVAVLRVRSVQVVDGVHRMKLDLGQISLTDSVELRSGLGGRRSWHPSLFGLKVTTDGDRRGHAWTEKNHKNISDQCMKHLKDCMNFERKLFLECLKLLPLCFLICWFGKKPQRHKSFSFFFFIYLLE